MRFTVLGQGKAVPTHSIDQLGAAKEASQLSCRTDRERRLLNKLYRMAGIQKRHSVLLRDSPSNGGPRCDLMHSPERPGDRGPSLAKRMAVYEQRSEPLAVRAAQAALADAGLEAKEISHLVTVSCSGFFAPGIDIQLIGALGLQPTVERAHIGFMGCHGALNGLRVARGLAQLNPEAHVLLCAVELCSIHYHYGWDPQKVIANALFADGSAALVGGLGSAPTGWTLEATGSCLIPASKDEMTWRIRDYGFEMSLTSRVPSLIRLHLRPWLESWLKTQKLTLGDVASWAVHPGGPRILKAVAGTLDLPCDALQVSESILQEYGNMSSPTILFILERLRALEAPLPCLALGFGPGLVVEAALFT